MAKVIDITDKLNFEESPAITIKGQVYKVNDSAETMLKLMGLFDDRSEAEAVPAAYELLFSEEDRTGTFSFPSFPSRFIPSYSVL